MSDSFSFWCETSRVRWAFAAAFLVIVAIAMIAAGIGVIVPAVPQTVFATVVLAGIAGNYRRGGRSPRLSAVAEALLLFIVIFGAGIVLSYAAASSPLPWRDAELAAIDEAMGFSWRGYAAFIDSSPVLTIATFIGYASLIPQLLILTLVLAIGGRFDRLHRFLIAVVVTLAVSCALFALTPAVAAYPYYGMTAQDFENLRPIVTYQHVSPIAGLRTGEIDTLSFADAHGLITFPSFHATGAALVAWGFWAVPKARWPFLALNILMLASTPVQGSHYLIDVIAGVLIAWGGVWIANRVSPPRAAPEAAAEPDSAPPVAVAG